MEKEYTAEVDDITNFMASKRKPRAHLKALKIAGDKIDPGFSFINPMDQGTRTPMSAMLLYAKLISSPKKILRLKGRIPYTTKGILHSAIDSPNKSLEIEFDLDFFAHLRENVYYKCLHTDNKMIKGKIIRTECWVSNEQAEDFTQIPNYEFQLEIEGSEHAAQNLHIDYGNNCINVMEFSSKVEG